MSKFYLLIVLFTIHSLLFPNLYAQTFTEIDLGITVKDYGSAIDLGDTDNDGDLDILVLADSVFLMINNGNNTFVKKNLEIGEILYGSIEFGDYNLDNNLDFAITGMKNGSGYSQVYKNIGNNQFDTLKIEFSDLSYSYCKWIDLNNDGKQDLILNGIPNSGDPQTVIYENKGNDSFLEFNQMLIGTYMGGIDYCDFDSDHDFDVILSGQDVSGNKIMKVFLNNSFESFEPLNFDLQRSQWCTVNWGDYDNDGDVDLVVSGDLDAFPNMAIYENVNDSLIEKLDIEGGGHSIWADWNNDGYLDIACGYGYSGSNGISFYENISSTFVKIDISTFSAGFTAPTKAGDIDNDGDIDVIVKEKLFVNEVNSTNQSPSIPVNTQSKVQQNKVVLNWNLSNDLESGKDGITYNLRIGTFSGGNDIMSSMSFNNGVRKVSKFGNVLQDTSWIIKNLKPDIYYWSVQAIDNSMNYSEFSSEGSFEIKETFTELYTFSSGGIFGDLDNDNDLDLLIGNRVFENDNSSFTCIDTLFVGFEVCESSFLDFNNDNLLDIFISGGYKLSPSEGLYYSLIYLNSENNSFKDSIIISNSESIFSYGDVDNDGDIDLFLSSGGAGNQNTSLFINNEGNLIELGDQFANLDYGSSSIIDINGDRRLDIFSCGDDNLPGDDYKKYSNVYINQGSNMFVLIESSIEGVDGSANSWADFNNDGFLDLLLKGTSSGVHHDRITKLYYNRYGILEESEIFLKGTILGAISSIDFNNDGLSDIILSGESTFDFTTLHLNIASESFLEKEIFSEKSSNISFGDYDNDGDNDMMFGNKLLINNDNWLNYPSTAPTNLQTKRNGFDIIFGWDKATDPQSTEGGLSYNLRVGTTPGGVEIMSPISDVVTGYRRIPKMGNCQMNLGWRLDTLPEGTYYWAVQAIDQSFMGGSWSEEKTFTISVVRADFDIDIVCLGSETTFTDLTLTTGDPITEWKWNFGNGNTSTLQNPTHTYSISDTFDVQLIAISSQYSDTITKEVIVKSTAIANFQVDAVCHGEASEFINQTDEQNLTINSWYWEFGDNQVFSQKNPDPHYYAQPGSYNVKLTVSSDNGCTDTITKEVIVAQYPVVIVSSNGPVEFCEGNNVVLSVIEDVNYQYQWKLNDIPLSDSTNFHCNATYKGAYSVDVENTLAECISNSLAVNVNVVEQPLKPVVSTSGYNVDNCPESELITLEVTESTTLYQYQWKRNGLPLSDGGNSIYENYLTEGAYLVDAGNGDCKASSDEINIFFNYDLPEKPGIVAQGPNVWYLASTNDTASQYRWFYNEELITDANDYIYVANQDLGTYKVSINMDGNCWVSSDAIIIPNVTGIEESDPFANLKIYPNPTPGVFTIEMDNQIYGELITRIFSQNAVEILNIKFDKAHKHFKAQVDLSGQGKGLYIISFILDKYKSERKLLVE